MEPRIHHFQGGWAVTGDGFATFSASKEEALRRFRQHVPLTPAEEVDALLEGLGMGLAHDPARSARADERTRIRADVGGPKEVSARNRSVG